MVDSTYHITFRYPENEGLPLIWSRDHCYAVRIERKTKWSEYATDDQGVAGYFYIRT